MMLPGAAARGRPDRLSPVPQRHCVLQPEHATALLRLGTTGDAAVAVLPRRAGVPDQHANSVHGAQRRWWCLPQLDPLPLLFFRFLSVVLLIGVSLIGISLTGAASTPFSVVLDFSCCLLVAPAISRTACSLPSRYFSRHHAPIFDSSDSRGSAAGTPRRRVSRTTAATSMPHRVDLDRGGLRPAGRRRASRGGTDSRTGNRRRPPVCNRASDRCRKS